MKTTTPPLRSRAVILAMVAFGLGCAGTEEITTVQTDTSEPPSGVTVECRSINNQYDECWAGMLDNPQLIYQRSSASCILNRSWGFNRNSGYIWVGDGCWGIFADVAGYHHGRGDSWDAGARSYTKHGHDAGDIVAGAVAGALVGAIFGDAGRNHKNRRHTTSNVRYHESPPSYSGCHGEGCLVDDPDDYTPNPGADVTDSDNWSDDGEWQGCHGDGCLVDDPD